MLKIKNFIQIELLIAVIALLVLSSVTPLSADPGQCKQAEIFVSPSGSSEGDGTEGRPFVSLEAARNAVRKVKGDKQVVVQLKGGVYELEKPLELTAEDSGTVHNPVLWQGEPGQEVRIRGGKIVKRWDRVTDKAILSRLPPEASGKVYQADLKVMGINDYGKVKGGGLELFLNDKPMMLSRWPNEGFVQIVGLTEPNTIDVRGTRGSKTGKFLYEGDRPKRWVGEKDAWVHGYWFWDWSEQRQKIESIDAEKRIISIVPPYHSYGYRVGQWFYAFNILAELDRPGEWYLDREKGILYFWPPEPIEKGTAVVSVLEKLINLTEVSNGTIQGMIFEAVRGTAIHIRGGSNVRIAGCVIRNTGGNGVTVQGGTGNNVAGCDIYGTGKGGIELNGEQSNRSTLIPSGLYAENNHIHQYGRWNPMYQPGISLNGVGNRACHNLIHDAPHMAIFFSGNDHLIEFNEIHNVCLESNDAGAIYAGRDWTMRGTLIRYNYLHHISGYKEKGCVGVYLDDMYCGTTIFGNIFYKVTMAAFIGGGRDCRVENNLFVDCNPSLHVDARGMNWAKESIGDTMIKRLNEMPYRSELWRSRYPELVNIMEDEPDAPKGNIIGHNVSLGGKWKDIEPMAEPYLKISENLVDQDPLFEGKVPHSFRLKDTSPAFKLGFKNIPEEEIGLYGR